MKITSIKYNPHVIETMHLGQKTGSAMVFTEALVGKWLNCSSEKVVEIREITPVVYDIEVVDHQSERRIIRVFNPIEVNYVP